eukprot:scaffold57679_cov47-Phaeocystis_antarctica.AAC.7
MSNSSRRRRAGSYSPRRPCRNRDAAQGRRSATRPSHGSALRAKTHPVRARARAGPRRSARRCGSGRPRTPGLHARRCSPRRGT